MSGVREEGKGEAWRGGERRWRVGRRWGERGGGREEKGRKKGEGMGCGYGWERRKKKKKRREKKKKKKKKGEIKEDSLGQARKRVMWRNVAAP